MRYDMLLIEMKNLPNFLNAFSSIVPSFDGKLKRKGAKGGKAHSCKKPLDTCYIFEVKQVEQNAFSAKHAW
jgi:hypothetical protein